MCSCVLGGLVGALGPVIFFKMAQVSDADIELTELHCESQSFIL